MQVKQEIWTRERGLCRDLASIQRLQQGLPGLEELRIQEIGGEDDVGGDHRSEIRVTFHAFMSFWARKGDCTSKEFFKRHGPRAAGE